MDTALQLLKKFFHVSDEIKTQLSERWREDANRRTTVILVIFGVVMTVLYLTVIRPPDQFPVDDLVTISAGSTLNEAAAVLQNAHIIRSTLALRLIVRITGNEKNVHAGDYLFKQPEDVLSIARVISIGAFGLESARIRVPEGATEKQMANIFSGYLKRFNKDRFLVKAQSLEGYLFPDTYFFLPNATEDAVILSMRQNFDTHLNEPIRGMGSTTLADLIKKSGKSENDIVILASIIEHEAEGTKDRKLISGVLWNRLAKNMPLQVDVTFGYTLGKGTFQLTTKDLTTDSPYNTYTHRGLPPTPIGSPSLDSLIAAANPTKSKYLYFLADRAGVTHFCKDFACQQANKELYF